MELFANPPKVLIAVAVFVALTVVVSVFVIGARRFFASRFSPYTYVKDLLNAEVPFKISSPLTAPYIVERLQRGISRIGLPFFMSDQLVGSVHGLTVTLHLHRQFVSNSFAPILEGKISQFDGKTTISGKFRMHSFTRVFMNIWFGFLLFWSTFGIPAGILMLLTGQLEGALFVVIPFLMYGGGVALLKLGGSLSKRDRTTILEKVAESVGGVVA